MQNAGLPIGCQQANIFKMGCRPFIQTSTMTGQSEGSRPKKIFPAFLPLPSQFNFLPVSILPLANFFFSFYHPIFFQNGESFLWPRRRLLTSNNDRQRRVFYRGRRHRREPRKQVLPTDHAHWRSCVSHLPLQVLQAPWQARAYPATLCL